MSTMNMCLLGFFLLIEVAPLDGTFTARAEVYTEKDVVVQCEDPKKFGSHYHCATIEGECTRMNKMNCHVVVKVAPRGVFELAMKDASFIATKSKMYSIINATGTFLAEVPPSGQEIDYKVDWDSFKHYPIQYTLIFLAGVCSCSVLFCFVQCAKRRVTAWHFRSCQRDCDYDCY